MRGSGEILAEPDKIRDGSWQMRSYTIALLKTVPTTAGLEDVPTY